MSDQHDPFDELMRRSLAAEAAKVEPSDSLHLIRARVRARRKPSGVRRPWMLTVGGAMLGAAAAVGLFTVLTDDNKSGDSPEVAAPVTTASASPTPAPESRVPSTRPTVAPTTTGPTMDPTRQRPTSPKVSVGTPEAEAAKAVPVYWLGKTVGNDTGAGMRLYRTFSRIEGRPAFEAVRVMTTQQPGDPDYESPWTGAQVGSVTRSDDMITVDFKALPRKKLEPGVAQLAVQQLIYTVQGAMGDSTRPIRITEQGRAAAALFGVVNSRMPLSRAPAADVQALVWIISPANGEVTSAPVRVSGIAAAFEAQVNWRATELRTRQTLSGTTMTKEGQKFSPFAFSPELTAGEWLIEASLISAQDGRTTDTDSKTIVVR